MDRVIVDTVEASHVRIGRNADIFVKRRRV